MVSVIINLEGFDLFKLLHSIKNVKKQTFQEVEMFVNCKKDKKEIEDCLKEESIKDVVVLDNVNFDDIVNIVNGSFIVNKIPEDVWMPNMIELKIKELEKDNDCSMVSSNFFYCDELYRISEFPELIIGDVKDYFLNNIKEKNYYSNLIKTEHAKEYASVDFETTFTKMLKEENVKVINCEKRLFLKQI